MSIYMGNVPVLTGKSVVEMEITALLTVPVF